MNETQQPDVQRGGPDKRSRPTKNQFSTLVDAVEADPGEWFSAPIDATKPGNIYAAVHAEYSRRHIEVRLDGGRVFVRVLS